MNKYDICNHLMDTVLYIGEKSQFEIVVHKGNKGVFTGINSPTFNYVSFNQCDLEFVKSLKEKDLPFICFAQKEFEEGFSKWCAEHNFVKDDDALTHQFENLDNWKYEPKSIVKIEKVSDEKQLKDFDSVSSQTFEHLPNAAFDFFKAVLKDENIALFLTYYENKPVGCGMVSFINNVACLSLGGVLAPYRRQGIGCELTKYRMNYIKNRGFKRIVVQNYRSSISYFQKLGFKPMGWVSFYCYFLEQ